MLNNRRFESNYCFESKSFNKKYRKLNAQCIIQRFIRCNKHLRENFQPLALEFQALLD